MKKILHITESLGGGVAMALHGYVHNSPQHWHFLVAAARPGAHDKMEWLQKFAGHYDLPRRLVPAVKTLRKVYDDIKPDWVHLHSSFAGGYGRLALLPRRRIIYTPHCYAFERRDVGKLTRTFYWLTEQILSAGGSVTAACSPRELDLAQKMLFNHHTILLPNAPLLPEALKTRRRDYRRGERLRIVMVGRMTVQKDPAFFLEAVKLAAERNVPAEFHWLGGGDLVWERKLRDAGVQVSGWISHEEGLSRLALCDIYFHSAAWESCPISLLEASEIGLLLVCRDIPSIASLPVDPAVPSAKAAVDTFEQLARGEQWDLFQKINPVLNKNYNNDMQKEALIDLYGE